MGKHTPWPWKWEGPMKLTGGNTSMCLSNHEGLAIIRHEGQNWMPTPADAFLLAAAPKLLETLEDIVEQYDNSMNTVGPDLADSINIFARDAIREAKGEF